MTTSARLQDVYGFAPDVADSDKNTDGHLGPANYAASIAWGGGPAGLSAGGYAYGTAYDDGRQVSVGAVAIARASGNLVGNASAHVSIPFEVTVRLDHTSDPILLALWQTWRAGACPHRPCQLAIDFIHQTRGRFAWSAARAVDSAASFTETLTVDGNGAGASSTTVAGSATVTFNPARALAPFFVVGGEWNIHNLAPFAAAPASQLQVFPTGSPSNALDDPHGNLQGYSFNHQTLVLEQLTEFKSVGGELEGRYRMSIAQDAFAGFGPDAYSDATLLADFAHTSTLAVSRVYDPTGEFDLSTSGAAITISIAQVPEPSTWVTLVTGALMLGRLARGAGSRHARRARRSLLRTRSGR